MTDIYDPYIPNTTSKKIWRKEIRRMIILFVVILLILGAIIGSVVGVMTTKNS
ncbi:hypothetical protein K501DRAFT_284908 [Backusella circina FSU 941]|nr:hypothetical protein K501DRAFT_284908 [Backusella circina FSU 941]